MDVAAISARPRVYIAGPISSDPIGGARNAIRAWHELWDAGFAPFAPHLDLLLVLHRDIPYEDCMEYDFRWLQVCDAVYRLPGVSPGADRETEYAQEHGIPVCHAVGELVAELGVRNL